MNTLLPTVYLLVLFMSLCILLGFLFAQIVRKKEIETEGFQLTKTENYEGTSVKFYSNSTYDMVIYVGKGEIADNVYEINFRRKRE